MALTYRFKDRDLEIKSVDISVGPVPGRKQMALSATMYLKDGGAVSDILAYFRSDENAELFKQILGVVLPTVETEAS